MTLQRTANGIGPTAEPDLDATLRLAHDIAVRLVDRLGSHPSRVRLSAGDVEVAVEWSSGEPPAEIAGEVRAPVATETRDDLPTVAELPASGAVEVRASTVGTFYRASKPGGEPFVSEGDRVRAGQQIAIIEAMKLMIPVEATAAGRVTAVLIEDGETVEYDQLLIELVDDRVPE